MINMNKENVTKTKHCQVITFRKSYFNVYSCSSKTNYMMWAVLFVHVIHIHNIVAENLRWRFLSLYANLLHHLDFIEDERFLMVMFIPLLMFSFFPCSF